MYTHTKDDVYILGIVEVTGCLVQIFTRIGTSPVHIKIEICKKRRYQVYC